MVSSIQRSHLLKQIFPITLLLIFLHPVINLFSHLPFFRHTQRSVESKTLDHLLAQKLFLPINIAQLGFWEYLPNQLRAKLSDFGPLTSRIVNPVKEMILFLLDSVRSY